MAEKKTEIKKIEKEYVIPLREKCRSVPRYKKTNKAVRTIKEFVARHMKIYDRDLNKIKIDKHLNEFLWFRGIRKPPYKVKVKAFTDGENIRVELVDMPDKLKFKKAREEKRETKAKKSLEKKPKSIMEKAKDTMQKPKDEKENPEDKKEDKDKDGIDDKKEEKEKKSALVEEGKNLEKAQAKKQKHTAHKTSPKMQNFPRTALSRH